MNELNVYYPDDDGIHDGYVRLVSGPEHPFHGNFNPAPGSGLGYNDLKTIEAHQFLKSVADGKQDEPSFKAALAVADLQAAVQKSWDSGTWQDVKTLRKD
jgi:hypothetical protein